MKIDLVTAGKKGFIKQDPKTNIYKPAPGYLLVCDDWIVQWINWDALEGKWQIESINGDSEYVKSNEKVLDAYKKAV